MSSSSSAPNYELNEIKGHEKADPQVYAEEIKDADLNEGAEVFGDVATVEEYGYVHRGLKSRHIQFIALGGTIGTGLFLGIGKHLAQSGPLSLLLGYIFTGMGIYAMMQCLGEMTTYLPLPAAIPQFASRYIDPAAGFAISWTNWYVWGITQAVEISAAATLIGFWDDTTSPAVWIAIIMVVVLFLNVWAVSIYGEAEFVFASLKILTITGLIIFAFIVDCGGSRLGPIGFRYWRNPGAMNTVVGTGATGRFAGLFSTFVGAAFSYGGAETVAVAAGEAENPRRNIPRAVRRVFYRILFFYVLGSLGVGVLVPYTDPKLTGAHGALASPWVIAIQNAGIKGLPSVINAVLITSASSAANADLYIGSRYLYSLAQNKQAPKIFLKCTKKGIPIYAVGLTACFLPLTFMSVKDGPDTVFGWLSNITTLGNLLTWATVLVSYLRFRKGCAAQGIDRSKFVFKASPLVSGLGDTGAWVALGYFVIIMLGNGWKVFTKGNWDVSDFIPAYLCIPVYIVLFAFWKVVKRTKFARNETMDLYSGKAAVDAMDGKWVTPVPRNWLERIWFWIA